MTPEQLELLAMKCRKQDFQQADLTMMAVQSLVAMVLQGKNLTPSDMMDAKLGYEVDEDGEYSVNGKVPKTKAEFRQAKFGHWNWSDEQLIEWLCKKTIASNSNDYALDQYFEGKELEPHGICLLKERERARLNPFAD